MTDSIEWLAVLLMLALHYKEVAKRLKYEVQKIMKTLTPCNVEAEGKFEATKQKSVPLSGESLVGK